MAGKKDLIERVSANTGIHSEDVAFIYDAIFEELKTAISNEGKFTVLRFGTWKKYQTKERGKLSKNFKSSNKVKFNISENFLNILNK